MSSELLRKALDRELHAIDTRRTALLNVARALFGAHKPQTSRAKKKALNGHAETLNGDHSRKLKTGVYDATLDIVRVTGPLSQADIRRELVVRKLDPNNTYNHVQRGIKRGELVLKNGVVSLSHRKPTAPKVR